MNSLSIILFSLIIKFVINVYIIRQTTKILYHLEYIDQIEMELLFV